MLIRGNKIALRTVLPSDADTLFTWENDKENWDVSGTKKPFTKKEIDDFIENQKDIYLDKQLRFMICLQNTNTATGCIDLFQFDAKELKAGVGILIDRAHRKNGHGSEALSLLIQYSFKNLRLRLLFCDIGKNNEASMKLFLKHNFIVRNTKKNAYALELENNSYSPQ